jgi:UDPglucose--hexose-1-phosphate uridylyltransferase
MPHNEVRKDYLLDRWVVIATERGRRPTDFAKKERQQVNASICPMCPGNEHMTPPAVLAYVQSGTKIAKVSDNNDQRHKNWLVRVVPNLYPAFAPPDNDKTQEKQPAIHNNLMPAVGHHEVLIESPNHGEHPADARIPQLMLVINAYIDRLHELSRKRYVKYVSIFRNHGLEAGASLSHAHSQIIATPIIPKTVKDEMEASKKFHETHHECAYCNIIEAEKRGRRLVIENNEFIVFAPFASVHPTEFWIVPKKHEMNMLNLTKNEVQSFAEILKRSLCGLKLLVNDPPYNYGFHLAVAKEASDYYHWHLEVYPKLAIWAGFELSTGMFINTVTPEAAAESLRNTISKEH